MRGSENVFVVGGAFDRSTVGFVQSTELGYLNPDRSVTGVGAFGDGGVTGGDADGEPYDTRVDLDGTVTTGSFFVADTLPLSARAHLSLVRTLQPDDREESRRHHPGWRAWLARRRPCVPAVQSGRRADVRRDARHEPLCGLQRRQPRRDVDRARLRRSGVAVQAAQCDGGRSAARSGGHQNRRGRAPRNPQRILLERGLLPRHESRRHPVRDVGPDRLWLLPQLRRDSCVRASSSTREPPWDA